MDNLENLYKKSFENFERKPKGDFWARLEQEIPPKPEQRRDKKWFFFIFGAGIFFLLGILVGHHLLFMNTDKELAAFPIYLQAGSSEKTDLTPIVNLNKETINTKNKKTVSNLKQAKIAGTPNVWSLNPNNELPLNYQKSTAISKMIGATATDKLSNKSIDKAKIDTKKNQALEQVAIIAEAALQQQNTVKKTSIDAFLPPKDIAPLTIIEIPLPLLNGRSKKRKKTKKVRDKYPFVGAAYTPISSGILTINDRQMNTRLNELVNVKSTKGWGIHAGLRFDNNWIFQVGIQQHQFQLSKNAQVAIPTNLSDAVLTENDVVQRYVFRDIAITEPLQGTVSVASPKEIFQNGDIFLLNLDLQQMIKVTGISSQIGYHFRLNTRWAFTPKVGLSASWGQKGKAILQTASLVDDRQQLTQINLSNTNVTTSNLIEGLVTTEIAYRYSKRISFTAAPQFRLSFAPFFNNHERSVRHHFGQLKFGIRIHL